MNIGNHIRQNRLRCNLTQEKLAEKLKVTAQAVSKWESSATMPDISLLPELATIFGITIDELFNTSEEQHLDRIEAMLERDSMLTRTDFDYAISRLEELKHNPQHKGRCLTLLADLYLHRSNGYADRAAEYARLALEINPESHDNHRILFHAWHGALGDWCCTNHTRLIEFYKAFIQKNQKYLPGYMWLIDNLIADGRLEEAKQYNEVMRSKQETYHHLYYQGEISLRAGNHKMAEAFWQEMIHRYTDNWHVWMVRGDQLAKQARYPEAIEAFRHACSLQQAPRMTDPLDSIAQICMLTSDHQGAKEAYEQIVDILRTDWGIDEGETIEGYLQNIAQLNA